MSADAIARTLGGGRAGRGWLVRCPVASHGEGRGDRRPSLVIADGDAALLVRCYAGCDPRDILEELRRLRLLDDAPAPRREAGPRQGPAKAEGYQHQQREKARRLWSRRELIEGSPAECYLRRRRAYTGAFPATLGYLPPHGDFQPTLIAAFSFPEEPEPGELAVAADGIAAVHLIRLRPDGSDKAEMPEGASPKISVGPASGAPVVLAPMNDLLGLVICEGIETGLSLLEATGCGVWAASGSTFMPALADTVPGYVDCVTIAGELGPSAADAVELAERLKARGLHVELRFLGG